MNSTPAAFAVGRLVGPQAPHWPSTYTLGELELRPHALDTPHERDALLASLKQTGETVDLNIAMRICTVCEAPNAIEADTLSDERFTEALDVLDFAFAQGLSNWGLLEAGWIRDLRTGQVHPRSKRVDRGAVAYTSFAIQPELFPQRDAAQLLLASGMNDLKQRLIRSIHWSRKGRWESSRQIRVLFRWFAMESIWKDGDEDILPYIMWALGYPNGQRAQKADIKRLAELQAHPLYRPWKPQIEDRLKRMKDFRHNTAHSGFRTLDIPKRELAEFDSLSSMACPRVQGAAFSGLVFQGKTTRAELLDYLPDYFNSLPRLVDDITGTVLYILANPSLGA